MCFIFKISLDYVTIMLRFRAKFTDKIVWPPIYLVALLWHCIYVFSLSRHSIMLKFYYMCGLGFIFNGLSRALSDKNKLIYYLIRFDKILTM